MRFIVGALVTVVQEVPLGSDPMPWAVPHGVIAGTNYPENNPDRGAGRQFITIR